MNKKSYPYTLIFMLVCAAAFTLVLALANAFFRPEINENEVIAEQSAILYAFDIEVPTDKSKIEETFAANVKEAQVADEAMYQHVDQDGNVLGTAIPFSGAGLWGTIRGYLAVTPDLTTAQGITFTEQNETPGLGGRIDEDWYKEQFRGIPLNAGTDVIYGQNGGTQLDAISGATQTSNSVLRIVNDVIQNKISKMEVQ